MNQFTAKYADSIIGVLSGFDRLVFRGTIRALAYVDGMKAYLSRKHVLLKDFGEHAESVTQRLKETSLAPVQAMGRRVQYLASPKADKEAVARQIAQEDGITEGPICVLTCVEPSYSFEIYRNRDAKRLQIVRKFRPCLHLYHYAVHPVFGFMNARIQTWFPFSIQVCLNGREWLSRQMDAEGMPYIRQGNCFVRVEDFARAQALMDAQLQVGWPALLDEIAHTLNPAHDELFADLGAGYYWSTHQSEWATDVTFREPEQLRRLHPMLVRHGMTTLGSTDVLRFLGHTIAPDGPIPAAFLGEVTSDIKTRQEGVRIKHQVKQNSVKAYDKAYTPFGAVLRAAETTINNGDDFKVYRPKEGDPQGALAWRPMRKGIADLHRRAQVSQAANDRYLNALASVDDTATLEELVHTVTTPVSWNGKRVRALHPFEPDDAALLEAISRGEFTINGLRNRDLQHLLYDTQDAPTAAEARRRSARVTRKLRLLRAHSLIKKVAGTHRYHVTDLGRRIITAILTARHTPVNQLLPKAA